SWVTFLRLPGLHADPAWIAAMFPGLDGQWVAMSAGRDQPSRREPEGRGGRQLAPGPRAPPCGERYPADHSQLPTNPERHDASANPPECGLRGQPSAVPCVPVR